MRLPAKAGDSGEHVIMLENVTPSLWNAISPPPFLPFSSPPPPHTLEKCSAENMKISGKKLPSAPPPASPSQLRLNKQPSC